MTHTAPKDGFRLMSAENLRRAIAGSFHKLSPKYQLRNPVMFVVFIGSILTTLLFAESLVAPSAGETPGFIAGVSVWLWFTVLFANFAESVAEGRGQAQAAHLKTSRQNLSAKRLSRVEARQDHRIVAATELRLGDLVLVEAGDVIPADGQIVQGIASVDESAITGESAPVIRESGGDRDSLTGGTRVLSDWLVFRVNANPGEMFIDKMISLVEGAKRQKTPNEIALSILLAALTLVFLVVTASLLPFSAYSVMKQGSGTVVGITTLVALLVCLAPTTIGGLLSAIGTNQLIDNGKTVVLDT